MAAPIDDNEKIHDLAIQALGLMLKKFGPNHLFPTDAIWSFIPGGVEILSTKKSHQPRRLAREGYLQETGAKTRAQSGPRAGSPTTEYRFGPKLVSTTYPPLTRSAASGPKGVKEGTNLSGSVQAMREAMESDGYVVSSAEIANFMIAMTASPIVILSGISGTGKSLLPRKFAKFTGADFIHVPVQPQWVDNSDLFGYVPSLSAGRFVKGRLTDPVIQASKKKGTLSILLLDEMNLSPVEHYFSDFLSVVESRERFGKEIRTDVMPFDLPQEPDEASKQICDDLRGIWLPSNLRVIGTANMDETTHMFSPKVLDRAFTIEFDDPNLTAFASPGETAGIRLSELADAVVASDNAINITEALGTNRDLFEATASWLDEIQAILAPAGIKFGYRTRDSILLYLHFWRQFGLSSVLAGCAALDFCVLQKVLPKVGGSGEALEVSLKKLIEWLEAWPDRTQGAESAILNEFSGSLERSRAKAARMLSMLDSDGATRFWGV